MNGLAVDAQRVVVELVAVSEDSLHGRDVEAVENSAHSRRTSRRLFRTCPGQTLVSGVACSSAPAARSGRERAQTEAAVELIRPDDDREDISHRPLPQPQSVRLRKWR